MGPGRDRGHRGLAHGRRQVPHHVGATARHPAAAWRTLAQHRVRRRHPQPTGTRAPLANAQEPMSDRMPMRCPVATRRALASHEPKRLLDVVVVGSCGARKAWYQFANLSEIFNCFAPEFSTYLISGLKSGPDGPDFSPPDFRPPLISGPDRLHDIRVRQDFLIAGSISLRSGPLLK